MVNTVSLGIIISGLIGAPLSITDADLLIDDHRTSVIASTSQDITLGFDLSSLDTREVVTDTGTFEAICIPGEGITYEYGMPVLPAVTRFVVVPARAGLELIVRTDEPRRVRAVHPPVLCSDSVIASEAKQSQISRRHFVPRDDREDGLYPPTVAEMSEPIVIRGVRLVKVTTYPIQYDHASGSYIHNERIETEIRFTGEEPVNPARIPVRRNRSREFLKYMRALAINGDEVGRDDPDRDAEPENVGHYLIVAHENCIQYAAPFIEWRRKAGYKVDILAARNPTDYNSVRSEIEDIYEAYLDEGVDPFEYILLIGDRSSYGHGPPPGWQLAAQSGHGDYWYALLEGRDDFPDVAISRWPGGSRNTLELMVGRTLMYEATPYMDDTSWFTRGATYSQHWGNSPNRAWHLSLPTSIRWGEQVLKSLGFDDVYYYEDFDFDQYASRLGPEITELLNEGQNVMLGRAELYWFTSRPSNRNWSDFDRDVGDNVIFPMEINTCGHGEWSRESMFRQGSGEHLKGFVATTFTWSGPKTLPNTAIWLEMVSGVMLRDLPFGWGYSLGITAFERYLDQVSSSVQWYRINVNDFGDPGLQPWIGVPRVLDFEYTDVFTSETRMVEVHVFDPDDDDDDVAGAQVTFYAPGDMPDWDEDEYAGYDGMFMVTKRTDADGMARFVFDEDVRFEDDETVFVTVTGRDILPLFGEIEVTEPQRAVELGDYDLTESEGNRNGEVNPGETFRLGLTVRNVGRSELEEVTAVVSSLSQWIEVEENEVSFGDIGAGREARGEDEVTIHISPVCPDGESRPVTRPELLVEFHSGEDVWRSGIRLDPVAPNFMVREVVGGMVIDVGAQDLDIDIENVGGLDAPEVSAILVSQGLGINVVVEEGSYQSIEAGGHAALEGRRFNVAGNSIVVPGSRFEMLLILSSQDGFVDTAWFELQVEESRADAPQGPDGYGYVCFDDTDDDWGMAPEYEWIEISPRAGDPDFNGTCIDFRIGTPPNYMGECEVVDLGFITQFYGIEYTKVSIATNGFIGMGEQPNITNFQNWPLDRGFGGGVGMVAPFWDDLRLNDESGIYYYHDREEARFIVEWYKLRHASGGNDDLTFQVIIYDKRFWITATGDQMILFQYKSISNVTNVRGGDTQWVDNVPYASVGISSPDGTTGINYSYDNEYPETSAHLEDRRAILFATSMQYFRSGFLHGRVIDVETRQPIEDATVHTNYGFAARTNADGYWFIHDALAEVPFHITATKLGYNDSTYSDTLLAEDDTLVIDFALLHPEFTSSVMSLGALLDPGFSVELPFNIRNDGNGPLEWMVEERLIGEANARPWEFRRSFDVGDTLNDNRLEGVVFTGEQFCLVGANHRSRLDDDTNMVYILDREGVLVDTFPQFDKSRWGMKDLAWDGELIWGGGADSIYGFTPEGELQVSFEGPHDVNTAIAWDPDRELLWICSITSDIVGVDRDGNKRESLSRHDLRIYGLAYWPDDPEGYSLYIFHHPGDEIQQVFRLNPDTDDALFVRELQPEGGGSPGGAFATNQFDVYSWVFICLANAGSHDRIDIWQLDARRDWFGVRAEDVEGHSGVIDAGVTQDFVLTLNSTGLPDTLFESELLFYHNAEGGRDTVAVSLDVIGAMPPSAFNLFYPADGDTLDSTTVTFTWEPSDDPNHGEEATYLAWFRAGGDSVSVAAQDTALTVDLDALGLMLEWGSAFGWWVHAVSGDDLTECNARFTNWLRPDIIGGGDGLPVEFGLQRVYPSPFNSMSTVRFGVDLSERTSLRVYDLLGREVAVLYDRTPVVGYHQVVWDASRLPSGLYIVRLESAGRARTAKVALVR